MRFSLQTQRLSLRAERKKQSKVGSGVSSECDAPLKKRNGLIEVWCAGCGEYVNAVTKEAASVLSDVDPQAIHKRILAEMIHEVRTEEGQTLICLNSLLK